MRIGCQIGMWKGEQFEANIAAIGTTGAAGVETFTSQLAPYHDEPERFKAVLEAADLVLSGAYFNSREFVNPDAEDDVVAEAVASCEFLRAVGGGFLILNGGITRPDAARTSSDEEFAQLAKACNRIGEQGANLGVGVVMHPHRNCTVETPADLDRLIEAGLDWQRVGLCVHASHQLLAGADPYEIYEKHAAHVRYVHVGDADSDKKGTFFGAGVLDQDRLMRPLLAAGFDGWIIIECGKEGTPPEQYAAKTIETLKANWPQVNWGS